MREFEEHLAQQEQDLSQKAMDLQKQREELERQQEQLNAQKIELQQVRGWNTCLKDLIGRFTPVVKVVNCFHPKQILYILNNVIILYMFKLNKTSKEDSHCDC